MSPEVSKKMYAAVRGSVIRLGPSSVRALATQAVSPAVKACGQRSRPLILAAGLSLAAAFFTQERQHEAECAASKIPFTGVPGTVHERTFIAVKPDGVQRGLVGEIIARFERKGYKLVALKMLTPTKEKAEAHYADLSSRPFFPGLVAYFSSGPIVAMCFEGPDVIKGGRRILGATNPLQSDPGTIRGDYAVSVGRNLIHGSDGPDSAKHEISNWFSEQEINNWVRSTENWISASN